MSKNRNQMLLDLYDATVEALLTKIKAGEASAAEIKEARELLKQNGITSLGLPESPSGQLAGQLEGLPFDDEEDRVN